VNFIKYSPCRKIPEVKVANSSNLCRGSWNLVGHVAFMGDMRIAYKSVVDRPERNRPLVKPRDI
jgi:hypothetical protein